MTKSIAAPGERLPTNIKCTRFRRCCPGVCGLPSAGACTVLQGRLIRIDDEEYALATIDAGGPGRIIGSLPMEGRWAPFLGNGFLPYGQGDERGGGGARHCSSGLSWPTEVNKLMVMGASRRTPGHSPDRRFYGRSMPQKKGSHVQPLPLPSVTSTEISSQSTSNPSRYTLTRIVYVPARLIFIAASW